MSNNKSVALLITCHNRRDETIASLKALYHCITLENHTFDVFLAEDGSTDGTFEAVKKLFLQLHIIQDNGALYWYKAMRLTWNTAIKHGVYDFFVWLNDDTLLKENVIIHLLNYNYELLSKIAKPSILLGAYLVSINNPIFSYSGRWGQKNIAPNASLQQSDEKVYSISGYTLNLPSVKNEKKDFYFGYRASSWGGEIAKKKHDPKKKNSKFVKHISNN